MDPPPMPVAVSELLQEISQLSGKRVESSPSFGDGAGDSSSNVMEQVHIQAEIFRKFAIIDGIHQQESHRQDATAEEQKELEQSKTVVLSEKARFKATAEDFKKMPIPSKVVKHVDKVEHSFPMYLQLLPDVRELVLSYLTSPQDRLNLLDAIPSEGKLMARKPEWQKANLQFELVFPILIEQRDSAHQRLLDWRTVHDLSRVSPYFRYVIASHYTKKGLFEDPQVLNDGVRIEELAVVLRTEENEEWSRQIPIFTKVYIRGLDQGSYAQQIQILKEFGHRIWECTIMPRVPPIEVLQVVGDCLTYLSQARRLDIINMELPEAAGFPNITQEQMIALWSRIENTPLPDLPFLQVILLCGDTNQFLPIKRKLLERYAGGIHQLRVTHASYPADNDNYQLATPNLENLCLEPSFYSDALNFLSFPSMLLQSPLKIIEFGTRENMPPTLSSLPKLLSFLGAHFAGTLEQFTLSLGGHAYSNLRHITGRPEPVYIPPRSTWLANLNFPKLKQFSRKGGLPIPPSGWSFLLAFPRLEKLTLDLARDVTSANYGEVEEKDGIVQISYVQAHVYASNIWKLLPHLQLYTVGVVAANSRMGDDKSTPLFQVTREDCRARQENQFVA